MAAAIALVIVIGGAIALLATRGGGDSDFDVDVGLVTPTDSNRLAPELVECPTEDRATSPLPDSDYAASTAPAARAAFGGGQLAAYNLRVTANEGAPDSARFIVRFSSAFDPGLRCAFLSVSDPATAEVDDTMSAQLTWQDASGAEPAGQVEISGLGAGDNVVAQLWVVVRDGEDPGRRMSLTVTPGVDTDAESVTRSDRANLGFPTTATGEPTIEIDDGPAAATLGGELTTEYTVTNATSAVLNRVVLNATIGTGATITGARVADTVGHATACRTRQGALVCELGFMNPGESVAVAAAVAVDATAISFWGRDTGPCLSDDQQDVCQRAVLEWAGPFSTDSTTTSEVTNIDDASVFSIEAVATVDVGYALGSVPVNILVTTDIAEAVLTEVSTTGCPMAVYAGGDIDQGSVLAEPAFVTDGDGVVNAGELWVFTCAARQYVDGIIDVVVAGSADGVPGRSVDVVEVEVINPLIEISRTEASAITWTVTNTGDVPLISVAVSADGCQPVRSDDGDGDTALDAAESWTYTCDAGAGVGRVFGVDPLGATVSAVDETGQDAGP